MSEQKVSEQITYEEWQADLLAAPHKTLQIVLENGDKFSIDIDPDRLIVNLAAHDHEHILLAVPQATNLIILSAVSAYVARWAKRMKG